MPINNRAIIHLDLDAFFVSVEQLRDERLKGIPLLIGGGGMRGVVASCSYEARKFGIHSAMPTRMALRLCPDAKVISGDMEAYSYYSRMVTEVIAEDAPLFEKASVDEFYVDVSGMDKYYDTYSWSKQLRKRIISETGLPISMGLSVNKMISKVVTGEYKPNGEKYIERGLERAFLAPLSVRKIPMVGEKTAQFLMDMGVRDIRTLREMPIKMLEKAFGKNGRILWRKANAIDDSRVESYSERKSISTECTFDQDSMNVKGMKVILVAMVEKLCHKLRQEQKLTSCVAVKIRYTNFDTETKQRHVPYTSSDQIVMKEIIRLFDQLYTRRMQLRLIGVRLSSLVHGNYQINLFEDTEETIRLYQAMDNVKNKHGINKITRAAAMDVSSRIKMDNNLFGAAKYA
ncbi:MAG: DNA polymerase IV [Cyclobacteriaceae bacterium]|nr:DNA polymerase IV [Cyclobacteriaceae bacterium HetDA_MAG_MS6]